MLCRPSGASMPLLRCTSSVRRSTRQPKAFSSSTLHPLSTSYQCFSFPSSSSFIPHVPGYQSRASFKWASYCFWFVLNPLFKTHFRYYQGKVRLDRMLEKQSFLTNTGMSVVIGLAIYFGLIHHLLPSTLPGEYYSLKEDAKEVLSLMGFDNNGIGEELPAFQLMKAKGAIIGKVYEVADIAEIHAQEKLVKEMLMRSKEGK